MAKEIFKLYFIIGFLLVSCGDNSSYSVAGSVRLTTFTGVGDYGIFDPSLAKNTSENRIYMSYSAVNNSTWAANKRINTRLAFSDDSGLNWSDSGFVINQSTDINVPNPDPAGDPFEATWEHEVSSICYDSSAIASERWKLVWHRYLAIGEDEFFEHGWIGMKSAATAEGLASAAEHKLFTGSAYDSANNSTIGDPEVNLDELHSDLDSSIVFSEPSIFAANNSIYICLLGAEDTLSTTGKIVLVKYPYPSGPWEYCGTFLLNSSDGPALGYDGFSASNICEKDGTYYLIVSPQNSHKYFGTLVFEITDLDSATLKRTGTVPDIVLSLFGTAGSHNGAAGCISEATASGILYSEITSVDPLEFSIFASDINL